MKLRHFSDGKTITGQMDQNVAGYQSENPVVVVVERGIVGPIAFVKDYEIIEATREEMNLLRIGGYPIKNEMRIQIVQKEEPERGGFRAHLRRFGRSSGK